MAKLMVGFLVPVTLAALIGSSAFAAEEAAKKTTVTGVVAVEKGADGAVAGVAVKDGDKVQKLVLDDKAKEVAKLDGKKVEVTGTADAAGALKVESFKEVTEAAKPAAKKTE